ncbi:hypothetical protein CLOHIR_00358 [Peptacetobacter hiranonis DSM 13275]|jgi:hypothetical protein|uniref:Uncharacterized protein n=1 Tax=Peptacetobacter hiranonis (strain DSM 13275 / JCM 10541 / KCTC 15199 / TO-931) TaxID=500633 RepID=B6FWV9_PEPHT|nr:hypothetical protein CLOHIR_00358 [Peptacetobacter hiranonis DSM 13275]
MKMKDIKIINIKDITLEEAFEIYKDIKLCFVVRDGMLKGFSR